MSNSIVVTKVMVDEDLVVDFAKQSENYDEYTERYYAYVKELTEEVLDRQLASSRADKKLRAVYDKAKADQDI